MVIPIIPPPPNSPANVQPPGQVPPPNYQPMNYQPPRMIRGRRQQARQRNSSPSSSSSSDERDQPIIDYRILQCTHCTFILAHFAGQWQIATARNEFGNAFRVASIGHFSDIIRLQYSHNGYVWACVGCSTPLTLCDDALFVMDNVYANQAALRTIFTTIFTTR